MKKNFLFSIGLLLSHLFFMQCDIDTLSMNESSRVQLKIVDTPPVPSIEKIHIHIKEVTIHNSTEGWISLSTPDSVFDLLEIVNGITKVVDTIIQPGKYTQMRLILGDSNSVVKDSVSYPLFIPSGKQSGIKFNMNITVQPEDILELYVDFDITHSLKFKKNKMSYMLKPTYKVFPKQ